MSESKTALISKKIDFWLLGGASLLVWLLLILFEGFRGEPFIDQRLNAVGPLFASLALFCNYPHFMASYKLAYSKGGAFILANGISLILVPLGLVVLTFFAFKNFVDSGTEIMGFLVNLMFFTVGWHYIGQVFGCMMVYAKFQEYKLSKNQRRIILSSLYSIWLINLIQANIGSLDYSEFMGLRYAIGTLPNYSLFIGYFFIFFTFLVFLKEVVWVNYKTQGKIASLNFLTPYLAIHIWWLPLFFHDSYYSQAVPFFHSLQYLVFIFCIEKESGKEKNSNQLLLVTKLLSLFLFLVCVGYLAFEYIPQRADFKNYSYSTYSLPFFMISAHVFINVHHYFIDNVIWKFDDSNMKKYILGE